MPIFRLEGDDISDAKLVIAQETDLELESHLESWLENSPRVLSQDTILWIGRQTSATFGVDSQGNLVIAELKKGRTPRDIIAQLLDYAAWADDLSEYHIRKIAEAYFKDRGVFQGKTFDDAFREVFDRPETEELPPLNRGLRLFIAAEEIPSRIERVCRFLRTSHGMDISCIAFSTFKTEAGERLVTTEAKVGDEDIDTWGLSLSRVIESTTEAKVGDEDIDTPKTQGQRTSRSPRLLGDKPLDIVIWETAQELMQGNKEYFTLKEVRTPILEKNPGLIPAKVDYQVYSDCVNFSNRSDYPEGSDRYWWVSRGKYRLYDPEKDKIEESTDSIQNQDTDIQS